MAFEEGEFEEVIKLADEFMSSGWQEAPEPMFDVGTAWATYLKAYAYEQLGNARNVLAVSDRVLRLVDSRYLEVLAWTALTLVLRGRAQLNLGDFRAAIATCDDIIQRFAVWENAPFGEVIADTLLTRGCSKAHLNDDPGAIRDYEQIVDRFGGGELLEIQAGLVAALMSKGLACRRLGDTEEEIRSYDAVIERFDSSDVPDIQEDVAVALGFKCMAQAEIGLADEALAVCDELDRRARLLSDPQNAQPPEALWAAWLQWRVMGARALALAVMNDHLASMDAFRAAYAAFPPNYETPVREMLRLVPALVAAGASPQDLLGILTGDIAKVASLQPLVVALHERGGKPVPAPREVREIAIDIHRRFDKARKRRERCVDWSSRQPGQRENADLPTGITAMED